MEDHVEHKNLAARCRVGWRLEELKLCVIVLGSSSSVEFHFNDPSSRKMAKRDLVSKTEPHLFSTTGTFLHGMA